MVYETVIDERRVATQSIARTLLVLTAGVFLGLMLAQVSGSPDLGTAQEALHTTPLPGEDWHGNVRRSTP